MAKTMFSRDTGMKIRARRDSHAGFEGNRQAANANNARAASGRGQGGQFISRGDRNAYRTIARAAAQNQRTNNTHYELGTKAEVQAQHNARYRDLRAAFGMSAG